MSDLHSHLPYLARVYLAPKLPLPVIPSPLITLLHSTRLHYFNFALLFFSLDQLESPLILFFLELATGPFSPYTSRTTRHNPENLTASPSPSPSASLSSISTPTPTPPRFGLDVTYFLSTSTSTLASTFPIPLCKRHFDKPKLSLSLAIWPPVPPCSRDKRLARTV